MFKRINEVEVLSDAILVIKICYMNPNVFCDKANYFHKRLIPVNYRDFAIF